MQTHIIQYIKKKREAMLRTKPSSRQAYMHNMIFMVAIFSVRPDIPDMWL